MSIKSYNTVAFSSNLSDRLDQGGCATIRLSGHSDRGQIIRKEDRPGEDLLRREQQVYEVLEQFDLDCIPTVVEYGGSYLDLLLINQAATLGDYLQSWFAGEIPDSDAVAIIHATAETLTKCYETGLVHGDLHLNNVVVTWENGQWKAYLIDFGYSIIKGYDDEIEYNSEEDYCWYLGFKYPPSIEGDKDCLFSWIDSTIEDDPPDSIRKALLDLEEVFDMYS
jgi:serine/threonine protein kinase